MLSSYCLLHKTFHIYYNLIVRDKQEFCSTAEQNKFGCPFRHLRHIMLWGQCPETNKASADRRRWQEAVRRGAEAMVSA